MLGGGPCGKMDGEIRGPGDMGGIAGQAVADVHYAADALRRQDGGGVKARPGLLKTLHRIGETLIPVLEGHQATAGEP